MADFINKIITVILIFVMIVIGSLSYNYSADESTAKRLILNDVTSMLDKITDKGFITYEDMDNFYMNLNARGLVMDSKIKRLKRTVSKGFDGTYQTTFIASDKCTVREEIDYELESEKIERNDTNRRTRAISKGYIASSASTTVFNNKMKEESTVYMYFFDSKDIVDIAVEEVTYSSGKKFLYFMLKIDTGRLNFNMSKMVR